MIAPCKDCLDRHFNCHGTCKKYQEFKLDLQRIAEKREAERVSTPDICRKVVKQIWREMKLRR